MLDVSERFLQNFESLSPEERSEAVSHCTIEEIELLADAGYSIVVDNGKLVIGERNNA